MKNLKIEFFTNEYKNNEKWRLVIINIYNLIFILIIFSDFIVLETFKSRFEHNMTEDNSEQFSLRWNNFFTNLTSGFHSLWQEEDFVDVTLAADGKFVQAHKIVLSVCSPYFMRLFKVNPCKHPIVILKDVGYKELSGLLQFMYKGEVNVYQEELANFLKTAELLQIKGLTSSDGQSQTKEGKTSPTLDDKRKATATTNAGQALSSKRKWAEHEQSGPSPSPAPSPSLSIPSLPNLEPIEFVESQCLENANANDALAVFFEGESSRPVTNKPDPPDLTDLPPGDPGDEHALTQVTERGYKNRRKPRRCRVCYKEGKNRSTTFVCRGCPRNPGLCNNGKCFDEFHSKWVGWRSQ